MSRYSVDVKGGATIHTKDGMVVRVSHQPRPKLLFTSIQLELQSIDGEQFIKLSDLISGLRASGYGKLATDFERGSV